MPDRDLEKHSLQRRFFPCLVAFAATVLAVAATAMPAAARTGTPGATAAAAGTGTVTVLVGGNGRAARALANRSVKVRAVRPATKRGVRLAVPVARIAVARSASLALRGGLRFVVRKRSLSLRQLRLTVAPRQATVTARVGKRRVQMLVARYAKGEARLNTTGNAAALDSAKLRLTAAGARLLGAKLGLRRFPAGPLGVLGIDASAGVGPVGGGGGGGGGGSTPSCDPAPDAPAADPSAEPAPLARPVGAVDVASATIVWRPRESWIRYVNGGEGTCVFGGAVAGPKEVRPGSSAALTYSFRFPFEGGWYDAASGTAAVRFSGGVGFKLKAHGINFSTGNPEIEIAADDSRGIFRVKGADGTARPNRREVLVDLTPGADQGTPPAHSFPDMPGKLPPGAEGSIFAGYYPPAAPFGTVSIDFATQP